MFEQFLVVLAHNEHFQEYRGIVTREIQEQLDALPPDPPSTARPANRELQPMGTIQTARSSWRAGALAEGKRSASASKAGTNDLATSATANMNHASGTVAAKRVRIFKQEGDIRSLCLVCERSS